VDSNPEHDWPMEQATDVRERRQREEVEPPQTGRPAPHLTALARELGAIEPDQEAWVDQLGAREDTVIPASTTPVQHYSEVIEPRPMADARVMKVAVTPEDRRDLQLAATDAHVGMDTAWVHVRDAVGKRLDGLDEPVRIQYMPNPDRRVVSAYSDDLNETVVRSAVREVTALYRELAQRIREPQPEARPGTVTQHYALPAETVRRVSELLSAAPARWVDGVRDVRGGRRLRRGPAGPDGDHCGAVGAVVGGSGGVPRARSGRGAGPAGVAAAVGARGHGHAAGAAGRRGGPAGQVRAGRPAVMDGYEVVKRIARLDEPVTARLLQPDDEPEPVKASTDVVWQKREQA
jgi:hypothetical protein